MQVQIDLEHMQKRLRKEQKVLNEQIEIERKKVKPSLTANPDRADLAYDYAYRARRMSLLEQLEERVVEVNKALKRIDEETYGICTNCGKTILPERIEALPYAELCIECQRKESAS
ncbi:MAG: TraR/DksA family transcriptional regulator [Anaerolineales bacterium]|jgi:DnaK suppressor protein